MIVLNVDRFFSGGRWGVIQTPSFRCALNTVHIGGKGSFAVIASFAGDWDYKNYEPIAEALLKASFSRNQVMQLHNGFLEQLDRRGMEGVDLGGAIEEVFRDAYNSGIVTRYENNASLLLKRQA
jgi:hypothetical protein